MKAEIITIGTEVTTGSILNTHSQYIANKLFDYGIHVLYHSSVDDDVDRIKEVFNIAYKRADLVITTGGLGPTQDDMSKKIIAESLGLDLEYSQEMGKIIEEKFKAFSRNMTKNNLQQAYRPKGAEFLFNSVGTAPGIYINSKDKVVIMLPGPKIEMKTMLNNEVLPILIKSNFLIKKSINLIGIGESQLESEIEDLLKEDPSINIATFARENDLELKITGSGNNKDLINEKISKLVEILKERFSDYIFGYDNVSIEEVVYDHLLKLNLKIGFAESCTGGLISGRFSRIPGASKVFDRSIVTYSNNAKIEELYVSKETLEKHGAVSEETAQEMLEGLLKRQGIDLALSITGIAGPDGGSQEKPVGLVYIGISNGKTSKIKKYNFTGNREQIQNKASSAAFMDLNKFLINIH